MNKKLVFGVVVFLISSISFAAGYLADRAFNHASIVIDKCST